MYRNYLSRAFRIRLSTRLPISKHRFSGKRSDRPLYHSPTLPLGEERIRWDRIFRRCTLAHARGMHTIVRFATGWRARDDSSDSWLRIRGWRAGGEQITRRSPRCIQHTCHTLPYSVLSYPGIYRRLQANARTYTERCRHTWILEAINHVHNKQSGSVRELLG